MAEKKDLFGKSEARKQLKHAYTMPRLTVHGTIAQITGDKGLLLTDTLLTGSVLG